MFFNQESGFGVLQAGQVVAMSGSNVFVVWFGSTPGLRDSIQEKHR
jgi:hypothetical protein